MPHNKSPTRAGNSPSSRKTSPADPIETELRNLANGAARKPATLEQAYARLKQYERHSERDNTQNIMFSLLEELPSQGQKNLIQDIIGRADRELERHVQGMKTWLFSESSQKDEWKNTQSIGNIIRGAK
ncbi:hypothetical protein AWENTII_008227 [Aspergillus wentii]